MFFIEISRRGFIRTFPRKPYVNYHPPPNEKSEPDSEPESVPLPLVPTSISGCLSSSSTITKSLLVWAIERAVLPYLSCKLTSIFGCLSNSFTISRLSSSAANIRAVLCFSPSSSCKLTSIFGFLSNSFTISRLPEMAA